MQLFVHDQHPRVTARKASPPPKVRDLLPRGSLLNRINTRLAVIITVAVGSMWCAYVFGALALVSLPSAVRSHDVVILVAWISQTFLQLVLLSVIMVGQNVQSAASDKRAEQTYDDAEAVLHEAVQIQEHLQAQDHALIDMLARLEAIVEQMGIDKSTLPPSTLERIAAEAGLPASGAPSPGGPAAS